MKILSNSMQGLLLYQKHLLYRTCVLPIILYGFLLWYYGKVLLLYLFKELKKMQRRAALWILGVFHTSSILEIKAIAGLDPIHLYFQKLSK